MRRIWISRTGGPEVLELREVLKGVEAGDFVPIVDAQVPFAEARKAHERLQDRQNFGKVVLVP